MRQVMLGLVVLGFGLFGGCADSPDEELHCTMEASAEGVKINVCLHVTCTGASCLDSKPSCASLEEDMNASSEDIGFVLTSVATCEGELSGTRTELDEDRTVVVDCYAIAGDDVGKSVCEGLKSSE